MAPSNSRPSHMGCTFVLSPKSVFRAAYYYDLLIVQSPSSEEPQKAKVGDVCVDTPIAVAGYSLSTSSHFPLRRQCVEHSQLSLASRCTPPPHTLRHEASITKFKGHHASRSYVWGYNTTLPLEQKGTFRLKKNIHKRCSYLGTEWDINSKINSCACGMFELFRTFLFVRTSIFWRNAK